MKERKNPFFAKNDTPDRDKLHDFNFDFCSRYAKRLSEGKDMRFIFEYELSCYETGLNCFHLGQKYTNPEGEEMKIVDRREDFLVIEFAEELYSVDYWHEGGTEYCIMGDIGWSSEDIQENK